MTNYQHAPSSSDNFIWLWAIPVALYFVVRIIKAINEHGWRFMIRAIIRAICWIILVPLLVFDLAEIWMALTTPLVFSNSGTTLGLLIIQVLVFTWIHKLLLFGALCE